MQLFHRKMECAQLIILLYYWQNQNQDVEAYVPQINLGELVKNQKNWDTISLSSFHSTLCFFYDFGKFDCTQHVVWGILLHTIVTILVIRNGKHIYHLQKLLKRDDEWWLSKKWNRWWDKVRQFHISPSIPWY